MAEEENRGWELIASHDRCFTIDGRKGVVDRANFDSPMQLETLASFQNMLYQGVHHDFNTAQRDCKVAYKLTYKLEKMVTHSDENILIDVSDLLNQANEKLKELCYDSDIGQWQEQLEDLMARIDVRLEDGEEHV